MRWLASLPAIALATVGACVFDDEGLPSGRVLRDDTAADFGLSGSSLSNAEISSAGLISPVAYTTGALIAKGVNYEAFTDPNNVEWAKLDMATPARIALAAPLGDYGNGAPVGVGITGSDNFALWMTGEIWLEAGIHNFDLAADDNGFLDLAQPDGKFTRVVAADWSGGHATGSFAAPADGWYGIRIGQSEAVGQAAYTLQHRPPGGAMAPLDVDRLRAPVGDLRGLVADAFDDYYLMRPVGRSLTAAGMLDQSFGTSIPLNTGITASTSYSFHWAAQARIDVGGDYTLRLDTDDGQRLRIDGTTVLDYLTPRPQQSTTDPLHLDPGWHDVVIDYTQSSAAAHARLRVVSGPDLAEKIFPLERVRPVVPRIDRVAGASEETNLSFAAGGTVVHPVTPTIPAGASVVGVDVEYTVNVQHTRDLQVSVISPDGSHAVLRPQGDRDFTGAIVEQRSTHLLDGKAASGTWQVEIYDASGIGGGNTRHAAITVHYVGGRAPIATTASYESAVHDLGELSRIDDVTFAAPAPTGSAAIVRLRTGTAIDDLMAQPWSDPVVSGQAPVISPGQLVQYRVELSSDGDHSAAFDWIQLLYRPLA